ncbi:hypothetical protein EYZ11_009312 [Aspergillus tanneri]|uniref:Uncharacterized protein n=1 Tax=Aspergillus tanneri TaxID=1220188 RepID=A0A4S3J8M1_9EURO|nr:hypothetical protein EYZ11_009312 [Aspergillus tanneri]
MASDTFNSTSMENAPLSRGTFQPKSYGLSISELIQNFLDRERNSSLYKSNLEVRIAHECASLQEERCIRTQLEQQLAQLQWTKSQLEFANRNSQEEIDFLRKELSLEKEKSEDLGSRLATTLTLHETLQKSNLDGTTVEDRSVHEFQLLLQIQRQQELITELQILNQAHETTINTLQATLKDAVGAFSCSYCSGSDCSGTVVHTLTNDESLCPQDLKDKDVSLSPRNKESGTWYEE